MRRRVVSVESGKEVGLIVNIDDKFERLRAILRETGGLAVAFSGGLDSSFLGAVASEELGDRFVAVTAKSPTYPSHERAESVELAKKLGFRQEIVDSNELDIPHFADNPVNRCYYCKRELFKVVRRVADRLGLPAIADGTNADDLNDHRPGRKAAEEQGVLSPLLAVGLGKEEIRELSRKQGLPTSEKPAFACLASRFPYGSKITQEKLDAVSAVEEALRRMGFRQFRVRHHGDIARVELELEELQRACSGPERGKIVEAGIQAGFKYVALDLEGYTTGSMNRGILQSERAYPQD